MVGNARPVIMNNRIEEGGDVWVGTTDDAESAKCRDFRSSDSNLVPIPCFTCRSNA